ncbi:MAG: ribonuclease III [Aquificae bacterium]|nr:ribonuclease III [Aquificota bacterium]
MNDILSNPEFRKKIELLEKKLGYTFKNKKLALSAITHKSFIAESNKGLEDYEVLEFLGDAVLSLIVSEILIKKYPQAREGELSQLRSAIVSEAFLSKLARKINLQEVVLLSKGEIAQRGMERDSLLCDVFEAVFGAIYVDSDYFIDPPRQIFNKLFKDFIIESIEKGKIPRDYKSLLQIITQRKFGTVPKYRFISAKGPEHEKIFEMECIVDKALKTRGKGRSKKEAEIKAAKEAYEILNEEENR